MISCRSHISIYFPSICKVFDANLDFQEKISQLLARLLNSVDILDSSFYNLYGCNKNLQKIVSNLSCSVLFASEFESFMILPSDLSQISLYYDNSQYSISYSKDTQASSLVSSFLSTFLMPIGPTFFALFDPSTNSIISMHSRINTEILILKPYTSILPGVIFDFHELSQTTIPSLLINSPLFFTNQMRFLINSLIANKKNRFKIVSLKQDDVSILLDFFKTEDGINAMAQEERNTLFLLLISAYNDQYISDRLHQLALTAMSQKSDIIKFEMVVIFVFYLPLAFHLILIQLINIFGGPYFDQVDYEIVVSLLRKIIFKKSLNQDLEVKFIKFLFLFGRQIFDRNQVPNSSTTIRLYQTDQFLLFDNNQTAFSIDGPVQIDFQATTEFAFKRPIQELLNKYLCIKNLEENVQKLLKTDFIDDCISIYGRINQRLVSQCPKGILYPFWEYLDADENVELPILS